MKNKGMAANYWQDLQACKTSLFWMILSVLRFALA
jgi:hypothetical protein